MAIVSWFERILCVPLLLLFLNALLSRLPLGPVVLHMIYALLLVLGQPGDQMGLSQPFLPTCLLFSHIRALTRHRQRGALVLLRHRFQRGYRALSARYPARVYPISKSFLVSAYAFPSLLT
jgi:hypothetical protein